MTEAKKFQVVGHSERRVDGTALVTGKPVFVDDAPACAEVAAPRTADLPARARAHPRDRHVTGGGARRRGPRAHAREHPDHPLHDGRAGLPGALAPRREDVRHEGPVRRRPGRRGRGRLARAGTRGRRPDRGRLRGARAGPVDRRRTGRRRAGRARRGLRGRVGSRPQHRRLQSRPWRATSSRPWPPRTSRSTSRSRRTTASTSPIEPHVARAELDPHGRLVITTSTQVPFHARRIVASACSTCRSTGSGWSSRGSAVGSA
jgi:hypothetical protein